MPDRIQPRAKKGLGQHFLASPGIAARIVEALAPAPGELVVEIGPGRGALTLPLAASGALVAAYEVDGELAERLAAACASLANVQIFRADIRSVNLDAAAEERGAESFRIAGNIPYNLTSTILLDLARWRRCRGAVLMVQREVGERILASAGERACGILSVYLQSYFGIERVLRVRPGSFNPPPKVESVVLRFESGAKEGAPRDREAFLAFLKGCFAHRRKKLKSGLTGLPGIASTEAASRLAAGAGADPGLRPEELSLAVWHALHAAYAALERPKSRKAKG